MVVLRSFRAYLEHLSDIWILIYIDIKIFYFAVVSLHCINQHGLEDVTGTAPGSSSLNHNWSLSVLQSVLPVTVRLHLLDIGGLI